MDLTRIKCMVILPLLLLLPLSSSVAGELSTVINGKSFHLGASEDWNEKNYGLGFEYLLDSTTRWKSMLMVNGFRDSDKNMSYMAGGGVYRNLYETDRLDGLYLDAGLNLFLMTREDVNNGRPFPGVLPSVTIGNRSMGFNLTYLPESAVKQMTSSHFADKSIRGILFLQLKVNVSQFFAD
jgi:hypothetical protein